MSRKILIVTAVQAEVDAIGKPCGTFVVAGGIGRTNAAAAVTSLCPHLCLLYWHLQKLGN